MSDAEWERLRTDLRTEAQAFRGALGPLLGAGEEKATGVIAGVAHLAYHLGAIRQTDRALRGPTAEENRSAP